ncbi:TIR domain-containing protein [Hoeflea sp.]|uniref:toll/interleukin-1 receptor domain-containing protein n=1 Tax=Hoeflea sp. TaxID=1940281 RepID=UPI003B02E7C2
MMFDMPNDIFISYRRDDEAGTAGRIYDFLIRDGGVSKSDIFKDVDNLVPGMNFVQVLEDRLKHCQIFIAIIGRQWLTATDGSGRRRLDNPHDYVRLEVASALQREVPLIPILVDGASVPYEQELPEDLGLLCQQHALEIRNARFEADIQPLADAIKWHRKNSPAGATSRLLLADAPISAPEKIVEQISPAEPSGAEKTNAKKIRSKLKAEMTHADRTTLGGLLYLADSGDPMYLYEVGTRFEKGHGVGKNVEIAKQYYRRSAKAGYVRAQRRLERLQPH